MHSKYYVTEVSSEKDVAQAISIWERNLPVPPGVRIKKYHWFYERNPYRKGKLWMLKLKGSDKAVGVAGVGYRRFSLRGKSLVGAIGMDFAVEEQYRTLGPAMKLQRTLIESAKKDSDFLYSIPVKEAQVVLKHFGWQKVAEFTRLVKLLRSGDYLERVVKPRPLARVISIPVDFLLRLKSMRSFSAFGKGFHSDSLQNSHSLYDRLWERAAREGLLMGERTSTFLNWRYFECPGIEHEIFGLKLNDKALQGVIVYYFHGKLVHVVDLICPEYDKERVMRSLMINFEKHCFSTTANSISIDLLGPARLVHQLTSMGYRQREQSTSVWIYTGEDKDLLAQLRNVETSYWTSGDLL